MSTGSADHWAVASRFTYPRSTVADVAAVLADLRHRLAISDHHILDVVCVELADTFAEHEPGFDPDRFLASARFGTTHQGEHHG